MIRMTDLTKTYHRGRENVDALKGVTLNIASGEFIAILGPSGSGKSTLMNLIGLLDRPSDGGLEIDGRAVETLSERERTAMRRDKIGFVFQQFLLVPTMTALNNVMLPMYFANRPNAAVRARELLDRVGLKDRADHLPHQLSGGELQRVAVARALANGPTVLLADEPTGNLDTRTAESVYDLFKEINRTGTAILLVTHNQELTTMVPRVISLRDGRMVADVKKENFVV
jgi:putative ABC transport system ATP-binding protein